MNSVLLVGNPNTGKTTLYNTLTKNNNHVGNWHGVTTDISCGKTKNYHKNNVLVYDLPGIYSLFAFSEEEEIAIKYLLSHKDDKIICIVDASNLRRNLLLALELIEFGFDVTIAVNMYKENVFDIQKLSKMLGINVVAIDARKKRTLGELFSESNNKSNLPYITKLSSDEEKNISLRFEYIDLCLKNAKYTDNIYGKSVFDKFIYNKFLSPIIFALVMLVVFAITFGHIGQFFSGFLAELFDDFSLVINNFLIKLNITAWAHSLIINGVVAGIGVVIGFLPQVVLLHLCMNFLENIGYLPRVAYMFDGKLKKIGLTGKSVFSILLGFGCTTSAMITTKALDNRRLKKQTALVLPFASCNAKLPIFLLISSVFFDKFKVFAVFVLYIFSISLGLFISFISFKIKKHESERFFLEIPKMRIQGINSVIKNAFSSAKDFVKRVGTTLVMCSIIVWILSNISFSFRYVNNTNDSILYSLSKIISPIFAPIGLGNCGVVVALLVGLSAKELIVSCLAITSGVSGNMALLAQSLKNPNSAIFLTPAAGISFLVFVLLYSPCVSAISVIAKEISKKFAVFVFAFQFAVAYVASLLVYNLSTLAYQNKIFELVLLVIVLALLCGLMIKYSKRKQCTSCKGRCDGRVCSNKRV